MAGSRNRLLLTALLMAVAAGCAGSSEPVTRAPKSEPAPPTASSPAPPSPPRQEAEPRKTVPPQEITPAGSGLKKDDPNVVVVDSGEAEGGPATLAEAARAERERRAKAGPPVAVITNKSLPEYARKGQITVSDAKEKKGAEEDKTAALTAAAEPVRDEQYWRNRALDIRKRWREVADEVLELEKNAASLRQRFYGEDDPYVRDSQIKPEWDRVLDRLRQARVEVETTRRELGDFLEEGRVAGVMDGWLREGIDLEPEEEEKPAKAAPPAQSIEPPVADEPPGDDEGGEA